MGVIQGSVLAALKFLLLITPLSAALRPILPTIRGITIAPQLFTDDCNLFATSEARAQLTLTLLLTWADMWNRVVQDVKTKLLAANDSPHPLSCMGQNFKRVHDLVLLGVGVSPLGTFSPKHLSSLLLAASKATLPLARASSPRASLRLDVLSYLYVTRVSSILSYSLPLLPSGSSHTSSLSHARARFRSALGLSPSIPDWLVSAEFGLLDLPVVARRDRLLMLYRVYSNVNDSLTPALFTLPLAGGLTQMDHISADLLAIGSKLTASSLMARAPLDARLEVISRSLQAQQALYTKLATTASPARNYFFLTKPDWRVDPAVAKLPVGLAGPYIRWRLADFPLTTAESGLCAYCGSGLPSHIHLFWSCPSLAKHKTLFLDRVQGVSAALRSHLESLGEADAALYLWGRGGKSLAPPTWQTLVRLTAAYGFHLLYHLHPTSRD